MNSVGNVFNIHREKFFIHLASESRGAVGTPAEEIRTCGKLLNEVRTDRIPAESNEFPTCREAHGQHWVTEVFGAGPVVGASLLLDGVGLLSEELVCRWWR